MSPRKKSFNEIQPTEVLAMKQMVTPDGAPKYLFVVYRDATTPKGSPTGAPKPDPVMFQLVDVGGTVLEREQAPDLGGALDYANALAMKYKLTLTEYRS